MKKYFSDSCFLRKEKYAYSTTSILGQYAVCIRIMYYSGDIINLRYCPSYDQSPLSQKEMKKISGCPNYLATCS